MEPKTDSRSGIGRYSLRTRRSSTEENSSIIRNGDWQDTANIALRDALLNERSKRWNKVVSNYRSLLKMLRDVIPPDDMDRPAWLTLLLYECHYHLGVALQQVKQQKNSIGEFTRAIKALFISRNGCMVTRCRLASCLMTPIYARRAFAHANSGDLKNATLDAEKAVVLDCTNPDVYCVRALVLNTINKTSQAAEDVRKALQLNQNHVCALILQGQLKDGNQMGSVDYCSGAQGQTPPDEHVKAAKLNPDSYHYLTVNSFQDEKILEFYDKFLYSLNVPHTISSVRLRSEDDASPDADLLKDGRILLRSASLPAFSSSSSSLRMPFDSRMSLAADSVPMTANGRRSSVRSQLKTARQSTARDSDRAPTVRSDVKMKRKAHYSDQLTPRSSLDRRRSYGQAVSNSNAKAIQLSTFIPVEMPGTRHESKTPFRSKSINESFSAPQQMIHADEGLQIFQEVNLHDAPRSYYRPWMGDRLPVSEVERKQSIFPPFKV